MGRCTYIIDTTLRCEGTSYRVEYCPWGRGRKCWDKVTSFEQYTRKLHEHLTSCNVKLYTIDACGKAVSIDDDVSLCKAVGCLQKGGELAIIAVKWSGPGPGGPNPYGRYKNDWQEVMKRFEVPGPLKCYYDCNKVLTGTRYICTYNHDFAICYSCWKCLRACKKEIWKKCNEGGAPWDGEVPDAPLSREYCPPDRDDVRHLNYVLCRLGFIDLDVFRCKSTRKYGSYTEKAVRYFRDEHGIRGSDMGVYDEATEKKMEELVHCFRGDGALYI